VSDIHDYRAAENRATALEQTFAVYDDAHPDVMRHMRGEADFLEKLTRASELLQKYQSTYGDPSNLPPDTQRLAEQLRQKEDELQKLRLSDIQRGQVSGTVASWSIGRC
jgi:E3 ubiquitin-protein ligase BRE1